MKNKYFSLVAMAAAAIVTSCSSDNLTAEAGPQAAESNAVTLTASMGDDVSTRVGMGKNNGKVMLYWHAGDQVSVQTKSRTDEAAFSNTVFTISDDIATGSTKATFNGTVEKGYDVGTYALYPYNENHAFTSTGITYNLPSSYEYTTVEGNIYSKGNGDAVSYPANSTRMPMLGTIADGRIKFQYLGGLLVIRIDKMPASEGDIVVSADQQLTGDFTVDQSAENPEIATSATSATNTDYVTFSYSNATKGGVGVFYLPVPTGSYSNLKVSMSNVAGYTIAEYGNLNVSRSDVITIPVYQGDDGTSYSCTYQVNGHSFFDLCLPSGTLWAETNVGAESPVDCGKYYAWGEVTAYGEAKDFGDCAVKTSYDWNNYKYLSCDPSGTLALSKYLLNGVTTLEPSDDAAYTNWGSFCRMPAQAEISELFNDNYTTRTWTTRTNGIVSASGVLITSKKNGKSIFLPAVGYACDGEIESVKTDGIYLSNSLYTGDNSSEYASIFSFCRKAYGGYNESKADAFIRYCAGSVRPVAKKFGGKLYSDGMDFMDTHDFEDGWE